MLKLYVRQGTIVDKIHEIFPFNQSRWLEKYISFNTQQNKQQNDFEKDFQKLMTNAFSGKILGNVRNSVKIKLIKSGDDEKKSFKIYQNKLSVDFFNLNQIRTAIHLNNT